MATEAKSLKVQIRNTVSEQAAAVKEKLADVAPVVAERQKRRPRVRKATNLHDVTSLRYMSYHQCCVVNDVNSC